MAPDAELGLALAQPMVMLHRRPLFLTSLLTLLPRQFTPPPIGVLVITVRVGSRLVTTDLATTAAATTVVVGGGNYSGLRPSKAFSSNARMPSRVMGLGL